ncbi:glycosyltransferase [Pseudanabaena sp. FACHB-1998]|uniref:glycosyltransferase n=1 Tax=Pseudanabaena sp. FACHB-1998 TaxID=2692858 RepID=UPI001680DE6E|nr:glycosyltransferase [Pseudanabaena sp. FACHB-1998]MBD2176665.1 glycosyltransferase [Pseudanabaena sp. FACHB-1998]
MRFSIILPCLNEIRHGYLERILTNLVQQKGDKEIIAVLSPSHDGTETLLVEYASKFTEVKIVRSPAKNRAQRLNDGLAHSIGEIILLHHPASLLPEKLALQIVEQAIAPEIMQGNYWGAFQHSFDFDHWLLRFTSWYSDNVRVKGKGIVYLDHCPFMERRILDEIGYLPDLDIFEDTVLSDRLCKLARPVLVEGKVITSARRFHQRGIYRHALLNQLLKICYHFKIDPQWLNRLYEQKASINVKY